MNVNQTRVKSSENVTKDDSSQYNTGIVPDLHRAYSCCYVYMFRWRTLQEKGDVLVSGGSVVIQGIVQRNAFNKLEASGMFGDD